MILNFCDVMYLPKKQPGMQELGRTKKEQILNRTKLKNCRVLGITAIDAVVEGQVTKHSQIENTDLISIWVLTTWHPWKKM